MNVRVDVREKRHDGIFDGFDHEWDEFWVFADLANYVPEFVDGDLFLLMRFLKFLYFLVDKKCKGVDHLNELIVAEFFEDNVVEPRIG